MGFVMGVLRAKVAIVNLLVASIEATMFGLIVDRRLH